METKVLTNPTDEDIEIVTTDMFQRGLIIYKIIKQSKYTILYFKLDE